MSNDFLIGGSNDCFVCIVNDSTVIVSGTADMIPAVFGALRSAQTSFSGKSLRIDYLSSCMPIWT